MPALMMIIAGMLIYAMNLESFTKALSYMFVPDWSKLTSEAFAVAVGHAFFTLSLGMGAIMIYSASLAKDSNIVRASLFVIATDTLIALAAGLVLFTFLFQYGAEPAKRAWACLYLSSFNISCNGDGGEYFSSPLFCSTCLCRTHLFGLAC